MAIITDDVEARLYEYMGGIVRNKNATLIAINGTPEHVHLLIRVSKSVADQVFIRDLKGDSSRWMNIEFKNMPHFSWQDGYGWFSVSPRDVGVVVEYIQNQKEHHRKVTFQDEFLSFLKAYGIEFDKRYLWE